MPHPMTAPATAQDPPRRARHDRGIEAIALFKMVKATALILVGLGAMSLLSRERADQLREWLQDVTIRQGHTLVERALAMLGASHAKITLVALASLLYGVLFAVEGVGLWLEKRWAEWLTIFATGSLIPFEAYELSRKLTLFRAGALVVNVVAVVYLVWRLRHPRPIGTANPG
ncbi:MAG: hypothetical protein JWO05_3913 [Gemmatimonadetes bacterium]|nr:hypothetical protein [Gemmatimonadota bacterium]